MSWKTQWFLWRYKFFLAAWNGRSLRKIVWTQSIRLHEQKLPQKQWTKLFYFIKNLNTRLNRAWYFFDILKFVFFVQSYASLGHFAQNLLVLFANLESSKNHLVVKPYELFCFKDTINVAALLVFLGSLNRQCICVKYFELSSFAWPKIDLTGLE